MTEQNYFVFFSDSKKPEEFSYIEFSEIRFLAKHYKAVLSEIPDLFGITLFVAFSRSFYDHYFLFHL